MTTPEQSNFIPPEMLPYLQRIPLSVDLLQTYEPQVTGTIEGILEDEENVYEDPHIILKKDNAISGWTKYYFSLPVDDESYLIIRADVGILPEGDWMSKLKTHLPMIDEALSDSEIQGEDREQLETVRAEKYQELKVWVVEQLQTLSQ